MANRHHYQNRTFQTLISEAGPQLDAVMKQLRRDQPDTRDVLEKTVRYYELGDASYWYIFVASALSLGFILSLYEGFILHCGALEGLF